MNEPRIPFEQYYQNIHESTTDDKTNHTVLKKVRRMGQPLTIMGIVALQQKLYLNEETDNVGRSIRIRKAPILCAIIFHLWLYICLRGRFGTLIEIEGLRRWDDHARNLSGAVVLGTMRAASSGSPFCSTNPLVRISLFFFFSPNIVTHTPLSVWHEQPFADNVC